MYNYAWRFSVVRTLQPRCGRLRRDILMWDYGLFTGLTQVRWILASCKLSLIPICFGGNLVLNCDALDVNSAAFLVFWMCFLAALFSFFCEMSVIEVMLFPVIWRQAQFNRSRLSTFEHQTLWHDWYRAVVDLKAPPSESAHSEHRTE